MYMERGMEMQEAQGRGHLVLVPFPLQGHMTPMLQLASILHSNGFSIIIAHPKFYSPNASLEYPDFFFLPIAENISENHISNKYFTSVASIINSNCEVTLQKSLSNLIKQKPHSQVKCIIYDPLMYCAEAVASQLKLPSIILQTGSASHDLAQYATHSLCLEGSAPLEGSISQELVPGLHFLRFKDLPSYNNFGDPKELHELLENVSKPRTSLAVIWNSVDCLEHDSLEQYQQQNQVRCFSIGPLHKMAPTALTSLRTEDTDCITWLDKQAANSVIYISLGSLISIQQSELIEMAWGLANSEQPFLWVVRPGLVKGSEWLECLPENYLETIQDRGHIVKWAPQKEVLAHKAVGGFLSHCGWNSTLESISEGVPMICRPTYADQPVNTRYVSHVWRTGFELENELERRNIETAIRRLMQDAEGEEMRQRASILKEKIKLSIDKGGTSYNSLNDLVDLILSF